MQSTALLSTVDEQIASIEQSLAELCVEVARRGPYADSEHLRWTMEALAEALACYRDLRALVVDSTAPDA